MRACRFLSLTAVLAWGCSFDTAGMGGPGGGADPDGGPGGGSPGDAASTLPDAGVGGDAGDGSDHGDSGSGSGDCNAGEELLPLTPSNFGPCVPEAERALSVPAGATYEIVTDRDGFVVVDDRGSSATRVFEAVDIRDQPGQAPELAVVSLESLELGQNAVLWATGPRALAIVAMDGVTVAGGARITAGGFRSTAGAGMSEALCEAEGGLGTDGEPQFFDGGDGGEAGDGGSGGGGGGFGTAGGSGAPVQTQDDDHDPMPGGAENADEDDPLEPLRGGCRGGAGHQIDSVGAAAGAPGGGGGALQIVSPATIAAEGAFSVSGGGGNPGADHGGGGGGGSGGGLVLEANNIEVTGALTANGGGGGEGARRSGFSGDCSDLEGGENGSREDGEPASGGETDCDTSGSGGDGDAEAADPPGARDGEVGDSELDEGSSARPGPAGGGGGGGGMGVIRVAACEDLDIGDAERSPAPVVSDLECGD